VRVHMANLRKKLETAADQPAFLRTESGIGYRFAEAG
jgi:DNA-binding response OmpR family regulator